jgi:hypothetical protein
MSFNRPKNKYFLRPSSADQDQCKLFGPLKATSTDTKNVIVLLQNKTIKISNIFPRIFVNVNFKPFNNLSETILCIALKW